MSQLEWVDILQDATILYRYCGWCIGTQVHVRESNSDSLVPRPSLSLSFAVTILEAGKKELSCLQNCYCKRKRERRSGNEARIQIGTILLTTLVCVKARLDTHSTGETKNKVS